MSSRQAAKPTGTGIGAARRRLRLRVNGKQTSPLFENRPRARAFRSRCQLHRKPELQYDVSG